MFAVIQLLFLLQIANPTAPQPPIIGSTAGASANVIPWVAPEECGKSGQVFEPNSMQCAQCGTHLNGTEVGEGTENRKRSLIGRGGQCECPFGSVPSTDANEKRQCSPCASGLATSHSGAFCVRCLDPNRRAIQPVDGKCPVCHGGILQLDSEGNSSGNVRMEMCVPCPPRSGPNEDGTLCVPCPDSAECLCGKDNSSSASACIDEKVPSIAYSIPLIAPIGAATATQQQFEADLLRLQIRLSELRCRQQSGQGCQQLANFCVLQDYSRAAGGACNLLEQIRATTNPAISSLVPQLFYPNIEASVEIFREGAIDTVFAFSHQRPLDILAMVFAESGQFLGQWPAAQRDGKFLQICPPTGGKGDSHQSDAFHFGRFYAQKCRLSLLEMLRWNRLWAPTRKSASGDCGEEREENIAGDILFFELYLRYEDSQGRSVLHQVPVLNENVRGDQYTGQFPNRLGDGAAARRDSRFLLTKRFFVLDAQRSASSGESQRDELLVRVPRQIRLHIHFQSSRDGRIYIPYLQIGHFQYIVPLLANSSGQEQRHKLAELEAETEFGVDYHVDSASYDKTIEVLMASFCSMAAVWAALQAYSWGRRSGKLIIDATTIVKLLLYGADCIGNVFLCVMGLACCWLTFAYKLQSQVFYVPLSGAQEGSFVAYMLSAIGLKAIGLAHTILTLLLVQTFFIDWERPRLLLDGNGNDFHDEWSAGNKKKGEQQIGGGGEGAEARGKQKRSNPNSVVIWRTYLIANEWNELQLYRKTHIGLQMLMMLFLLDFLDYGNWAKVQPGFQRHNQPVEFSETRMSRFAVDLSFYFSLGIAQWLLQVILVERLADPFRNFMDLCSVANISVLAMTNPLRGFYIHGRSVHGFSDTDMLQMNTFLQRERENLCALRGLENGSDLQTFVCSFPRAFRDRVDQILAGLRTTTGGAAVALNLRATAAPAAIAAGGATFDRTTIRMQHQAKVYAELNDYLKDFVNRVDPQGGEYQVTDARFIEELLGLELADTSRVGAFRRDRSEMAYSSVFLYGNEWALLSFEMLLFCVLDLFWRSRLLAAFCTYLCSKAVGQLTNLFFTQQLARSSLVDSRFLI